MLIRYYAWHIFGLASIGGIVLIWHLFRVRRDGGIAAPKVGQNDIPPGERITNPLHSPATQIGKLRNNERITRHELLRREIFALLLVGGILILIATFLPAPIEQPMNLSLVSLAEARAPWFFLWVQELLKLGNAFVFGILTPLLVLTFLAALPYLFPRVDETEQGRWFPRSGRVVQIIAIIVTLAIITFTILSLLKPS
jgi:quinol-cytochrome oxidoreductase complex cytochrome b subunit